MEDNVYRIGLPELLFFLGICYLLSRQFPRFCRTCCCCCICLPILLLVLLIIFSLLASFSVENDYIFDSKLHGDGHQRRSKTFGYLYDVFAGVEYENRKAYKTLGLSQGATLSEIKDAHRALAKKFHPDKNPDCEDCEEKFFEIQQAYEHLLKSQKDESPFHEGDSFQKSSPKGFKYTTNPPSAKSQHNQKKKTPMYFKKNTPNSRKG